MTRCFGFQFDVVVAEIRNYLWREMKMVGKHRYGILLLLLLVSRIRGYCNRIMNTKREDVKNQ